MKTLRLLVPILALTFCSALFAQDNPPTTIAPLPTDILTAYRGPLPNGTNTRSSFTLATMEAMFPPQPGPGISVAPFVPIPGTFLVSLNLINSPTTALGYYTGVGAGQSVTQSTSKSTGVSFSTGTFTGVITMNNASLSNATAVQFTVTDPYVAASDTINVSQASNPTHAYLIQSIAQNGNFVVTVYNASGGSLTDALVLNFVVVRASGN